MNQPKSNAKRRRSTLRIAVRLLLFRGRAHKVETAFGKT